MNIQQANLKDIVHTNTEPEKAKISIDATAKADLNASIDTDKDM